MVQAKRVIKHPRSLYPRGEIARSVILVVISYGRMRTQPDREV
jgi:hypothetical protein